VLIKKYNGKEDEELTWGWSMFMSAVAPAHYWDKLKHVKNATVLWEKKQNITEAKGRAITPTNCSATKAHVLPACNQIAL